MLQAGDCVDGRNFVRNCRPIFEALQAAAKPDRNRPEIADGLRGGRWGARALQTKERHVPKLLIIMGPQTSSGPAGA